MGQDTEQRPEAEQRTGAEAEAKSYTEQDGDRDQGVDLFVSPSLFQYSLQTWRRKWSSGEQGREHLRLISESKVKEVKK